MQKISSSPGFRRVDIAMPGRSVHLSSPPITQPLPPEGEEGGCKLRSEQVCTYRVSQHCQTCSKPDSTQQQTTTEQYTFPSPAGGRGRDRGNNTHEQARRGNEKRVVRTMLVYARSMRQNPTEAERKLWEYLRFDQLGVRFRRQHPIGNYILDFYCHEAKLAIEVDGSHHLQKTKKEQDSFRSEVLLEGSGITVLRFTNDEVLLEMNKVLKTIRRYCDVYCSISASPTSHPPRGEWPGERERTAHNNKWQVLLCIGFLSFLLPVTALARALISEVMWMGSDLSTADEWVEITNVGDGPLSLSGWTLTSLNASGVEEVQYRFGEGDILAQGEYALVSNDPAATSRLAVEPRFVSTAISLPNTKLLLRLRDAGGLLIDEVDDGVGTPFAGANPSGGIKASMERVELSVAGNIQTNWVTAQCARGFDEGSSLLGTPGYANGCAFASSSASYSSSASSENSSQENIQISSEPSSKTQSSNNNSEQGSSLNSSDGSDGSSSSSQEESLSGRSPSDSSVSSAASVSSSVEASHTNGTGALIRITELLPDAEGSDDASWIEIGNLGSGSVNITGWTLEYGTKKFVIPQRNGTGFVLQPAEYVAFRKTQTALAMLHAYGTVTLKTGTGVLDTFTYGGSQEGISFARSPEYPSDIVRACVPTEGQPNVDSPWDPMIKIQSGKVREEVPLSINLEAVIPERFAGTPHCTFDFDDGFWVESCNPATHTYERDGHFTVRAEMVSACGNTRTQTLTIDVLPKPSSSSVSGGTTYVAAASTVTVTSSSARSSSSSVSSAGSCLRAINSGVIISEFLPDPEGKDTEGEWIELQNTTPADIPLCGWSLGVASGTRRYPLDDLSVPAFSFLLLTREDVSLSLRNSEDSLRLFAPDVTSPASLLVDEVHYSKPKVGKSFARTEDGTFAWTTELTPGGPNAFGSLVAKASDKNTKTEQGTKEASGTKSKSASSKKTQKTSVKTSTTSKRSTNKKSSSSRAIRPLSEDAVPLLAGLEAEGQGGGVALSWIEVVSLVMNGIFLIILGWWGMRRKRVYPDGSEGKM